MRSAPEPEQLKAENPQYVKLTGKEDLEPQTDRKDNLVSSNDSQQSNAQQNVCSVEAEEEEEEFEILSIPDKKADYNQKHSEASEAGTKKAQFVEVVKDNNAFHTAIVGYKLDRNTLHAAEELAHVVGKKLNLRLVLVGGNTKSAKEMRKFLTLKEISLFRILILVVEKATAISGDQSFLDVLTEIKEVSEGKIMLLLKDIQEILYLP